MSKENSVDKETADLTEKRLAVNEAQADKPKEIAKAETPSRKKYEKPVIKKLAGKPGEFCVYLGPSIRGVIQHGMILSGSKEKAMAFLAPAIENYPLIAELIVPGATLAADRVKVKTPGNLLNVNYKKLAAGKKSE